MLCDADETIEPIYRINAIPFIGVCLVLVIIVLMTFPPRWSDVVCLELPMIGKGGYDVGHLALTLSLTDEDTARGRLKPKAGARYQFYFEEDLAGITPNVLWPVLNRLKGDNIWSCMIIRTHRDAPFEHLARAYQCAQALGVDEICLAVHDPDEFNYTPE